jgi:hypothetical protein
MLESNGSVRLRASPVRLRNAAAVDVLPNGDGGTWALDPADEGGEGNDGDIGERSRLFLTE